MSQPDHLATERRAWMGVLARAAPDELEALWRDLGGGAPAFRYLRRPETGLVMVRGRAGGDGRRFNLGEMTVTRCSVRIEGEDGDGAVGHGYVVGRDRRHAELAAVLDGLLQDPARRPELLRRVVGPLAERQAARRREVEARAAATRVEFFTMVRGD